MEAILNLPVGAFGGEETYGVSLQRGEIIAFIAGDFIMEASWRRRSSRIFMTVWRLSLDVGCRVPVHLAE
jgi:hypothetical protein